MTMIQKVAQNSSKLFLLSIEKADEEKRARFNQRIDAYQQANKPIVYLDERCFAQSMPRTHGYAQK